LRGCLTRFRQLFDSTDSERIPRDLPRTWSIYESRSPRVLRYPESRREPNGSLSTMHDVTIVLVASGACLRSPEIPENRELGTKTGRQRDTKIATATERQVRGQNRVRGLQLTMGKLTDTCSRRQGMILGLVLSTTSAATHKTTTTRGDYQTRLCFESARTRMIPWISRSRVDSGVNSARRGARINGQ